MTEERERRAVPRAKLDDPPATRIRDGKAARLLDVSRVGAGIEHRDFLRPGASCSLELPPPFNSLTLPAQVVWCRVIGRSRWPGDEPHLVSRSGLRFTSLDLAQHAALAWLLGTQSQLAA